MQKRRHGRAGARIRHHRLLRVQDLVLIAGRLLGTVVLSEVLDSRQEGDDEGQQTEADAEQRRLGVQLGLFLTRFHLKTEQNQKKNLRMDSGLGSKCFWKTC